MKMYGTEVEKKENRWYCPKCNTYNVLRSKVCALCGTPHEVATKVNIERTKKEEEVDRALSTFLRSASLQQKAKLMRYIDDEM